MERRVFTRGRLRPAFGEWMKAGGPEDPLIWSRALKAFEAKNGYLIRYVKRFASPELQRDLDELASVYRRPSRVEGDHHPYTERHADILMMGIVRLAQLNPSRAYQAMIALKMRWKLLRAAGEKSDSPSFDTVYLRNVRPRRLTGSTRRYSR